MGDFVQFPHLVLIGKHDPSRRSPVYLVVYDRDGPTHWHLSLGRAVLCYHAIADRIGIHVGSSFGKDPSHGGSAAADHRSTAIHAPVGSL